MWSVCPAAAAGREAERRNLNAGSGRLRGAAVGGGHRPPGRHPHGAGGEAQPQRRKRGYSPFRGGCAPTPPLIPLFPPCVQVSRAEGLLLQAHKKLQETKHEEAASLLAEVHDLMPFRKRRAKDLRSVSQMLDVCQVALNTAAVAARQGAAV